MNGFDPAAIAAYFDAYGAREWDRLTESPTAEVGLHVHLHHLEAHLEPGMRVLEIGAGAGRFTMALAELGCRVLVADLSVGQLALNRSKAAELGFADAVEDWVELDICDMGALEAGAFDAVVCYGGPLSYVFDARERALDECLRVLRPQGLLLASVMSLWGAVHHFLPGVYRQPPEVNAAILRTGDLTPAIQPAHHCHLYRADELSRFLARPGVEVLALSASHALSAAWGDELEVIRADPQRWAELLRHEVEACQSPGLLDAGTHIVAVARWLGRPRAAGAGGA